MVFDHLQHVYDSTCNEASFAWLLVSEMQELDREGYRRIGDILKNKKQNFKLQKGEDQKNLHPFHD